MQTTAHDPAAGRLLPFAATLFVSAVLLFWVQLLVSKVLLPILGGSAAVWTTCMVFFQAGVLAGYLYAHLSRGLSLRRQVILHLAFLIVAGLALRLSLDQAGAPPAGSNPAPWLFRTLALSIGPAFVALAATAPMLQSWVARTRLPAAADPYFLYVASNLGSFLALVSYPIVVEPALRISEQTRAWEGGYALLVLATAVSALAAWLHRHAVEGERIAESSPVPLDWRTRAKWLLLAFVPSSLLLGVTDYLTTDVAPAPLFWAVPLALYLLTFVIAFRRSSSPALSTLLPIQAVFIVVLGLFQLRGVHDDPLLVFALHLATFFAVALVCHRVLALDRPPTSRLTEFYLILSVGGVLGGVFNALIAPLVFDRMIEYPLVLILACLLRPGLWPSRRFLPAAAADFVLPGALLAILAVPPLALDLEFSNLDIDQTLALAAVTMVIGYGLRGRPLRFALGVGAILLAGVLEPRAGRTLLNERNFYGALSVIEEEDPAVRTLYHGSTTHGAQSQEPARRLQPLSYYHPDGPLGHLFRAIGGTPRTGRVAIVGLGAGSVACYGHAGESWTFYEINPAVVGIAHDFFTFLSDCPVAADIVLGDARLSLARAADGTFGTIVLDAFNSDAIPIHLLTRQALMLYLSKLRSDGLLVFHISNRFVDLAPVLGNLVADLGLSARRWSDDDDAGTGDEAAGTGDGDPDDSKDASDWVVIARGEDGLAPIASDAHWTRLPTSGAVGLWTDDFSNLFGALIH